MTASLLLLMLAREPALVELYSSEGCSSCPPADDLLRTLSASDDSIVALEFQVDYWNSLGWRDPFSSPAFSERQSRYAAWGGTEQVYTPQAIVDGRLAFVGSSASRLAEALQQAHVAGKASVHLTLNGTALSLAAFDAPAGELWVAITEAGLESQVGRGENRGRLLRHAPLVRQFLPLGQNAAGSFNLSVTLKLDTRWRPDRLRVIAAIQDPDSGRILAVGTVRPNAR